MSEPSGQMQIDGAVDPNAREFCHVPNDFETFSEEFSVPAEGVPVNGADQTTKPARPRRQTDRV